VPNDSGPRDTVKPPAPTTGRISVSAPENATITFLGKEVGKGDGWSADSLKPGRYQVTASVPSPIDCPSATETAAARVVAGRLNRITLRPRACGSLSFDATPAGSRWTLKSLTPGDSVSREGVVPVKSVVLPTGEYERIIMHARCANYADTVTVDAQNKPLPRRSLFCER
jgi:hypothetical protein